MMVLMAAVVFTAVAGMIMALMMPRAVTIVGMPMVISMAVVVLMLVFIAHESRSLLVACSAPVRGASANRVISPARRAVNCSPGGASAGGRSFETGVTS
jgi:hypothetical protein